MADLELKRTPDDRRRYALEGVGTLRLEGFVSRAATAEAGGSSWRIARRGFWRRVIEATDAAGAAVGEFEPRGLRRGGRLRWAARELTLCPASHWRERYSLADDDRELVILDGKGGHRHRRRPRCDRAGAPALRGLRRPRTGRGRRGRHCGGQLGHLTDPDSTQARLSSAGSPLRDRRCA